MLTKKQIQNAVNDYIQEHRVNDGDKKLSKKVEISINHSTKVIKTWDNLYIIRDGRMLLQVALYPETYKFKLPKDVYDFFVDFLKGKHYSRNKATA